MTASTAAPAVFISLHHVARTLAVVLCFGGTLNVVSKYEWMPFRCIDLYSWAPASEAYRPFWHVPFMFLPIDSSIRDGMNLEDLPGMIVYGEDLRAGTTMQLDLALVENNQSNSRHSFESKLRRKISDSKTYVPRQNNSTVVELHLVNNVYVAVEPIDAPINWNQFFFDAKAPRVTKRCYSSYRSLKKHLGGRISDIPYRGRGYSSSVLHWLLMFLPVALLAFDLRLPGMKAAPARRALFSSFPRIVMDLKFWIWDNVVLLYNIGQAKILEASGLATYSGGLLAGMVISSAIATWWVRGRSLTGRPLVTIVWVLNQYFKCWALSAMTFAIRDHEITKNLMFPSMFPALFAQALSVSILADLLVRFSPPAKKANEGVVLSRDDIEAGLIKFVAATFFYSAGVTKLGACGLQWIDDRYLVQLALRGQLSQSHPFPLESLVLDVPPVVRDFGLATVLVMELTALYAWYFFGPHVVQWFIFMIGSTMSIGVPLHPSALGFLRPFTGWTFGPLSTIRIVCIATLTIALFWVALHSQRKGDRRKSN